MASEGTTVADRSVIRALNTVRGTAFDAAARCVLWLRDILQAGEAAKVRDEFVLIADRLLAAQRPTLHAAFGRAFGWLLEIDKEWTERSIADILPSSREREGLWEAAFAGVVGSWHSSPSILKLLREAYVHAVDRIRDDPAFAASATADAVATHLVTLYWRGDINLDDPMLNAFFEHAPGKLRGRVFWVLAHNVDVRKGVVDAEVHQRPGVKMNNHHLIERLAEVAASAPELAFSCYALLIQQDRRERFLVNEESGRDILRAALSSPSASAARDLIHSLASEGVLNFRDLLEDGY